MSKEEEKGVVYLCVWVCVCARRGIYVCVAFLKSLSSLASLLSPVW